MKSGRVRQLIDLLVTVAMGVAALLIIWRILFAPNVSPAQARGPVIQDVAAQNLVTSLAGTPVKGDRRARAVLIEFSDFECPFCKRHFDETFGRIDEELVSTGRVRYAFRNLPLDMHKHAVPAAQAAECAARQGKFWEMRQHLFNRQSELGQLGQDVWLQGAGELGLREDAFKQCLDIGDTAHKVRADQAEGTRLGAKATPTFLVGLIDDNDNVRVLRKMEGALTFEAYRDAVEGVLKDQ